MQTEGREERVIGQEEPIGREEARQRLDEYSDRERRVRRRFIAPWMIFFAIFEFVYLLTAGFGLLWMNVILVTLMVIWFAYSRRLTGVAWSRRQNVRLGITLFLGMYWGIACRAYFVNWNPHELPYSALLGGILAAVPFLVLARTYRP